MKVQCESCGTKLSLPEDKLTPGTSFSFNCPKCHHKNTVNVPTEKTPEDSAPLPAPDIEALAEGEGGVGEIYDEGTKLALICFDPGPTRDRLKKIMQDMDYIPIIPSGTRDALNRIRLTQFNVILLDENYDGQNGADNAVLRLIQPMEMSTRRRVFVALFGKNYKTLDQLTAYALSVNAVANLADEPEFDKFLRKALADYERFYKVYFDVMRELGKF